MQREYARVIVDISHDKVDRPFSYRIPEPLRDVVEPGMQVIIPFGKGDSKRTGFVIEVTDEVDFDRARIKTLYGLAADAVPVEGRMIRLAWWMKRRYGSTMINALRTVLPVNHKMKPKEEREVLLIVDRETAEYEYRECLRKKQNAKARALEELLREKRLPYSLMTKKLGISAQTFSSLQSAGLIRINTVEVSRNPVTPDGPMELGKTLSDEQQHIVTQVTEDYRKGIRKTYLIHGITGSGKTEVYLALISEVIRSGKQAIVLIPEISLTYQTVLRFYKRFGDRVSVMNSSLSPGEKYDQCERARKGEIDVIIGPRSALFTPFHDIGMIIIDEEHESSYKSENMPKYHARETAIQLAKLHGASVVLGSATPSAESYYKALNGEYELFRMTARPTGGTLPEVQVVDMREELKKGNRTIFSDRLRELLEDRLSKGEQSMLFINRRGYAGFISCRSCGHVMKCPHCDVSLSEHRNGMLECHYCGHREPSVKTCPSCGSRYIGGFRAGTEQIEEQLARMYPTARILRMDADTTKKKESYEAILAAFAAGEADILVGTQMIVKGHDFGRVTLMGVIAADLSLAAGDYRAGERTFQLLTQAAGRAGRAARPGEVVIQTYQPDHYCIQHAANQDYEGFYQEEILYRELLAYPPAAHIMAVQVTAATEENASGLASALKMLAEKLPERTEGQFFCIGPAAASISKINDIYRYVLYVKSKDYEVLTCVRDHMERYVEMNQIKEERVQFDFDPVNPY